MLPSCMELMAMLPPSTMVAAFTLIMLATSPLTTPMLMVPDMVHTPTWNKMYLSKRSADTALLYGANGNAAPFYYSNQSNTCSSQLFLIVLHSYTQL